MPAIVLTCAPDLASTLSGLECAKKKKKRSAGSQLQSSAADGTFASVPLGTASGPTLDVRSALANCPVLCLGTLDCLDNQLLGLVSIEPFYIGDATFDVSYHSYRDLLPAVVCQQMSHFFRPTIAAVTVPTSQDDFGALRANSL